MTSSEYANPDSYVDESLYAVPCRMNNESEIPCAEVLEETLTEFYIKGADYSGQKRMINFQIVSLPTHGILFQESAPGYRDILTVGDVLNEHDEYPYQNGVKLYYKGRKDFFTTFSPASSIGTRGNRNEKDSTLVNRSNNISSPSTQISNGDGREYFDFMVTASKDGVVYAHSQPSSHEIVVINVNDMPSISFPIEDSYIISSFTSFSWNEEDVCIPYSDQDENLMQCTGSSKAHIHNISITDRDRSVDFLRVDVSSSNGLLTLNQEYLSRADFITCINRNEAKWSCKGTGIDDREMTFLARPNEINLLLNGMTFESLIEGDDMIVITMYYGIGGECLSNQEHVELSKKYDRNYPTIFEDNKCISVKGIIPVHVVHYHEREFTKDRVRIPLQLWVASIAALTLTLMYMVYKMNRRGYFDRNIKLWINIFFESKHRNKGTDSNDDEGNSSSIKHIMDETGEIEKNDYDLNLRDSINYQNMDSTNKKQKAEVPTSREIVEYNPGASSPNPSEEHEFEGNRETECEWYQYKDPDTRKYYYEHIKTRRVTWSMPKEDFFIIDD